LWRSPITVAALDPFRGYRTALRDHLPHATDVVDAFHIVKLGFTVVDEVRRRVQQQQLGHRGHRGDPLYNLPRRADRLSERNISRLEAALHAGDPNDEVLLAWYIAQDLAKVYTSGDAGTGKARATAVIAAALTCPIPEIARLGRTLTEWRPEILAYFDTGGASNGPTEAVNLLIEKIRRVGHGYRNFANYPFACYCTAESNGLRS
jgi:transposase